MKQPELGRKIASLRSEKRLTQEELVAMCNISVRTIQRIESGEVTPRDFTVKAIFNALGADLDQVSPDEAAKNEIEDKRRETNNIANLIFLDGVKPSIQLTRFILNASWITGIIYFVLRFFEGYFELNRFGIGIEFSSQEYIFIKMSILITFFIFQLGFIGLGSYFNNPLIKKVASVYILASFLIIGYDMVSVLFEGSIPYLNVVTVYGVGYGVMGIIFGYSLLKLELFGNAAKVAGVFEIIAGLFSVTVVFAIVGPMILIPAEILEIIILMRASEQFKKEKELVLA